MQKQLNKELVSIVILNYNGGKITLECIDSIKKQTYKNYEIIVVDNDSRDNSLSEIKKRYKEINIIKNNKNQGYAEGNNIGIKKAKGSRILILNNDTILEKKFLANILKNDSDIVGAKNYYYDKNKIIWAVGARLNKILFRTYLVGIKEKDKRQYDKNYSPEQIPGSAMLVKKEVFNKIGYLNADYFCYYEETEWQIRAKSAGFKISFEPGAVLWHRVAYSSGGGSNPNSDYYLIRNRLYFIKNQQKYYLKPISYSAVFVEAFLKSLLHLIKRKKNFIYPLIGFKDFLKGKVGVKK